MGTDCAVRDFLTIALCRVLFSCSSHEKPTPPVPTPAPVPPAIAVHSHPTPVSTPSNAPPPPASGSETESQSQSWEEPTTAQPPTWDDPQVKPLTFTTGTWASASEEEPMTEQSESQPPPQNEVDAVTTHEPPAPEPEQEQLLPASKSEPMPQQLLATPILSQPAAATPSPKLSGRSAASYRSSARYKNIDQPVVMPSSFGTGIEKVGMQFGSLSLGGENLLDSNP